MLSTKRVFWFSVQLLTEIYLVLRRIQRDVDMNVHVYTCRSARRVPAVIARFYWRSSFRQIFRKILKYQISQKYVQWERNVPCGQTDRKKLQVAFCSLPKRLKIINDNCCSFLAYKCRYKICIDISQTSVVTKSVLTSLKLADPHVSTLHTMSPYVITRHLQTTAFSFLSNCETDHTL